jgi:hypothetical protein
MQLITNMIGASSMDKNSIGERSPGNVSQRHVGWAGKNVAGSVVAMISI